MPQSLLAGFKRSLKIPPKKGLFFWFVFFGQAKKMNKQQLV
jgi:hypothetical protein